MKDIRVEALMAVADDFYKNNKHVQYDQRSMDRYVQMSSRRRKFFPPEAGTSQYGHHLDCSGFCFAVYYQALGMELPHDITWHMYELMEPVVYKYEKTFNETYEEKLKIAAELEAAIQPGDLITMLHQGQSGHIMLAVEDGKFIHCIPTVRGFDGSSYNYPDRTDKRERNGLIISDLADITRVLPDAEAVDPANFPRLNLFAPRESKIVIHRPWVLAESPTDQAKIRMGAYKGLISGVESSHPGGLQAACGDVVEYRVRVKNTTDVPKSVSVEFTAPAGTSFGGEQICEAVLEAGEEKVFTFGVIVETEDGSAAFAEAPLVKVNGLTIHAKKVLLGRRMAEEEMESVVSEMKEALAEGKEVIAAAAEVYGRRGITLNPSQKNCLCSYFHNFDTMAKENNNVLVRKEQKPWADLAAYSLFGGKSVVTSELLNYPWLRITEISSRDLMAGDIILCGNDVFGRQTHAMFYTGESLIGAPEQGLSNVELTGEAMEKFIISLFGRMVWIVLRPGQAV